MESSKMKNMIVLKNLPSNIIEEAIVILKENKKIKPYQYIEDKNQNKNDKNKNANIIQEKNVKYSVKKLPQGEKTIKEDYILKEAEMVISNYISELEMKSSKWKNNMKKLETKYRNSIKLNFILAFAAIVSLILSLV